MFFEPKNLERHYEKFQVVFYDSFLDNLYVLIVILLSGLILLFFFPTLLVLLCQYIVLNLGAF